MAHNITNTNGKFEVATRRAAWHHLTEAVGKYMTVEETLEAAAMDYPIVKTQLSYNGIDLPSYALMRGDLLHDPARAFITNTTETFEVIQTRSMFAWLNSQVHSDNGAFFESAGSISNGLKAFVVVDLNAPFVVGPNRDEYRNYLTFLEDRSGMRAAKAMLTNVCVVCDNTFEQAYGRDNDRHSARFVHRSGVHEQLMNTAGMFAGARFDAVELQAKLESLTERVLTRDSLSVALDKLFPASDAKAAESTRRENKILDILSVYENNNNSLFPATGGTAYNLFQAITEQTDHHQSVRRTSGKIGMTDSQIRAERAFVGEGAEFKQSALDIILGATLDNVPVTYKRAESVDLVRELIGATV